MSEKRKPLKFYKPLKHGEVKSNKSYPAGYVCTEKGRERRLKYFREQFLQDPDIQDIKRGKGDLTIIYKNGQVFRCKGWLVEQSEI